MLTTAIENSGSATLGTSSRSMMRARLAPIPRAASTNSRWAKEIVLARAIRTMLGMVSSASANAMLRTPGSRIAASAISRISGGTASTALVTMPMVRSTPLR